MEDMERTLLVKPEIFVYKIPPRPSARGYRAADWNLTNPDWSGRLRCVSRGKLCELRLEDKSNGELFASCPVEQYPGPSLEAVTDSSRYFVLCIKDGGRKAFIGVGFADRSDSFDLNVTLQDHFNYLRKEVAFTKEAAEPSRPNLDLAFKEGQTIRINIPKRDGGGGTTGSSPPVAKTTGSKLGGGGGGGFLPPPPAGAKIIPPPGSANLTPMQSPSEPCAKSVIGGVPSSRSVDLLGDLLGGLATASSGGSNSKESPTDPWGDFASALPPTGSDKSSGNWEQF